jgi:putative flippase GtrA
MVGGMGFIVDGGLLTLAMKRGLDVYVARTISFSAAVLTTYLLHRVFTFASAERRRAGPQLVRYWLIQLLGAATNFGLFLLLVRFVPAFKTVPLVPLALGAAASVVLTFSLSRQLFRGISTT